MLASISYNGTINSYDIATGVVVDNNGNIIVTGYTNTGVNEDYCTIKYNNDLSHTLASAIYNGPENGWDKASGVTVDNNGNIIVTGYVINGANEDYCTIKYNNDLSLVLGLATYKGSANGRDYAYGVVVDKDGNIIVAGICYDGMTNNYWTVKYNNNLSLVLASATYNGPENGWDEASAVTVDSNGNIIVTGYSDNGVNHDYFSIKYNGSPRIFSVSPASTVKGRTFDLTINGVNFFSGAEVFFSGEGIIVNSINFINSNQLRVNITVTQDASSGRRDVTVINIDEASVTLSVVFEVRKREVLGVGVKVQGGDKGYINIAKGEEATIYFKTAGSGEIKLRVYTLRGQLIWKKSKESDGEEDFIIWDGKNSEGTVVASGVYVIFIEGPGINTTKKIAIIK